MDLEIEGKRAAVAAGSSGLGLGVAHALASEGVRVAICGRDPERLERAVESLGVDAAVVPLVSDVGTAAGATSFVDAALEALGGIDILVPNAGGPPAGNFASTDLDAYPVALELNLLSTIAMCKRAVPLMQERGWGRVVTVTSSTVRQPAAGLILSNVARTGATAFLKTLATEVARDGVTVNSVQPGMHDTDRLKHLGVDAAAAGRAVPTGVVGDALDFGRVVAFLCSQHARFVTGVAVPVDGGAFAGLQ
jgi:3-oxoacyl-[acyl-carrier protein] reductase